jgi:acetylserotonin N-methyltransferase
LSLPDPKPVLDLIEAFRHSKTLFTALTLGVFDQLRRGPATAADLANQLGLHEGALVRLLDGCAALGLLQKDDSRYRNLPVAEHYLCSDSPDTLSGYIRYSDQALFRMWANLGDAVREGTPRWKQSMGVEGAIFSGFYRDEAAMRDFLRGMHGFGMLTSPKVVAAFDLSRFRHMVDLGGGTGHLAIAACRQFPELRAVVFDLPRVTTVARENVALAGIADRVTAQDGDFFRDELPEADLYAVGRILHDWSDQKVAALLRTVFDRLPSGGALLIAEKLLNDDGVGPLAANMQSLNMLVVTEGQERSLPEFTRLLNAAGFTHIEGKRTGVALDAILAVKPWITSKMIA